MLALVILAATLLAIGLSASSASAAIPSNYFTVADQQGVNDVNAAQVDLTQFGRDDSDLSVYKIFWSWDATDQWTGTGQTGDACALFDTDGDTNINFVVCGQIINPGADPSIVTQTTGSPYVFTCSDARADRCSQPSDPLAYNPTDVTAGALTSGNPLPSPPANLITDTDPFANADPDQNWPNDSTLEVVIAKSFLPAGAVLVNVCSYPSAGNGGNNNPFDCIVTPGGGFLVVHKVAPSGTTQDFSFTVDNPGATINAGPIAKTIKGSGQTAPVPLEVGGYGTVTEHVPSGWSLDSASCTLADGTTSTGTKSGSAISAITIQSGKVTDCTFTNVGPPSLDFTKVRDAASVSAGSPIGFTLSVTNSGLGPANGVQITDTLPTNAGLSWSVDGGTAAGSCSIALVLTCNVGTLAVGATATVHITSSTTFATCGTVNNTGSVSSTNGSASPDSDSVSVQCPNLLVTKTADSASVTAGDQIGFVVSVSNSGPGIARSVTISDALPTGAGVSWSIAAGSSDSGCSITANTLSCSFGDLAANANRHVHVISQTTSSSCKAYLNTATADATNHPRIQDSATTTVNCGSIALTKVADAATVSAGDQIGFVITATNTGAGEARTVTVTDTLPATAGLNWSIASQPAGDPCAIADGVLTCNFGTLAGGASRQVHITSATTSASCATINNQAAVRTSNDGSAQAGDSTTVNCGDIALTKVADATSVTAGSQIGFVMTATNGGSGEARNVTLTDRLPTTAGLNWSIAIGSASGCSIAGGTLTCNWGTLASRASKSVHITSPTTMASCARINNSASVSTSNDGSDEANASTSVKCGAIAIDKTGAATAQAGQPVLYTLVVTNPGQVPFLAPNVNVADALCDAPPLLLTKNGDASPDQLDPGDQWTYTCTVQTQVGQTVVNNVGVVAATDSNGNVLQDDDPATTQLTQPPVVTPPAEEVTPPPAPVTPSGTPVPVAAVLPVQIATARLSGPKRCVSGPFEAKVIGRGIAKVVFLLDGRRLKTVNGNAIRTVFKVLINPRGRAGFAHRVTARVTFRTATKKPARTLRLTYLGCPRKIAAPQFTG